MVLTPAIESPTCNQFAMSAKPKIYSIQVSGIKCTNCAGKITSSLNDFLKQEKAKVSVNILQQMVTVSMVSESDLVPSILQKLTEIGFPAIKDPILIEGGEQSHRYLTIRTELNSHTEQLETDIKKELMGIVSIERTHEYDYLKFKLCYDSDILKGKELAVFFEKYDPGYIVINQRVESFKSAPKQKNQSAPPLYITGLLCGFFLVFNMILPFTGTWYQEMVTFPTQFGIFAFSVLLNTALGVYVFLRYSKAIIYRAIHNYTEFRATDMETLIALGTLSAISLWIMFLIKYGWDIFIGEGVADPHEAVMDINDALTSASIIVLVVTIGKHFEQKVKNKIEAMSEQIFPESTLFSQMKVEMVELKNRKLKIKERKQSDFTLLEKDDIICVNSLIGSRLLVDVIVISGSIRAMQGTTTGCDEVMAFEKGDRIESGAVIYASESSPEKKEDIEDMHTNSSGAEAQNECLAMVENVFEKSMLVEIGTQIKFSQNQESSNAEGIQAVCKSIASIFVKCVVGFSVLTMLVWALLIKFEYVELEESCSICWIVERGIGVLVASCPCALGLAVPSVVAIVLNLATKSGILIKNNGVFEKMKITRKIAFDKTGTLFTRINKIEQHQSFTENFPESQLWEVIALLEKEIRHPLAEILYKEAFKRSQIEGTNYNFILVEKPKVQKNGISAVVRSKLTNQTQAVLIGNKEIVRGANLEVPEYIKDSTAGTELFLVVGGTVELVLLLNTHSNLRPEAVEVVNKIIQEGEEVHILSGDSRESVEKLAQLLRIPEHLLHPEHSSFMKMEWIKEVQLSGKNGVMMIGDGLNDIPCLQESAVGVSINAKSELNINAADVVILEENLYKILALIRLLKKGNLFININLFWAFAYNLVAMPIVAGVFYHWGLEVSPVASSIAMSLSSIVVVSISHLLSLFHFDDSLTENGKKVLSSAHDLNENAYSMESSSIPMERRERQNKKAKGREKGEKYLQLIESH